MSVGICRGIAEDFGRGPGFTVMYAAACLLLLLIFGRPHLRAFSLKYLLLGVGAANVCAICFIFSLSMAEDATQTMQVGMVNYLWPCLTIVFAVLFNGERARWWIVPGVLLSLLGVMVVLGGEDGFNPMHFAANWMKNPWSYTIALVGAVLWAGYGSMTRAWSGGHNPVVIIFFNDMLIFGLIWLLTPTPPGEWMHPGWLGVFLGAAATGLGYGVWTYGMQYGNMTLLGIGSYFTPVLSCVFASFYIGSDLSATFWQGVALVVLGSLVCWTSVRKTKPVERKGEPLNLHHKHLPEMEYVCGLMHAPVFVPIVGDFYKGMATTVMLPGVDAHIVHDTLAEHYANQNFATVAPTGGDENVIYANTMAGRDSLRLIVCGHEEQTIVTALFDNLGKGASGAAVQNMNIMLGLEETTGLTL